VYPDKVLQLSRGSLNAILLAVTAVYVVAIQIPLLSPYRHIPVDEMMLVDAAYGVSSGASIVPAGPLWSHIIPETGVFFAAYTPLYLHLQALALRLVGLRSLAIGLLHLLLRLTGAGVFYQICRMVTHSRTVSYLFVAAWATMAVGPTGRCEDLAVLFLLGCVYLLVEPKPLRYRFELVGLFVGLTFLSYPAPLGVLLPLCLVAFYHSQDNWSSRETLPALARKYLQIALVAGGVSSIWLCWIIPYWREFKVHFLEFAVPDALAPSYANSLASLAKYVIGGFLTSPFPFHYSLLPVLVLLGCLISVDIKRNGVSFRTILPVALALVVAALTARVRIHKTYNLIWFIATVLVLLPPVWTRVFPVPARFAGAKRTTRLTILVLAGVIGLQLAGHLFLASLDIVGEVAGVAACGPEPHAEIISAIPPGDKVLTNVPQVFYHIRDQNPVYWPAGLQGETPGKVAFSADYDDSFRWLILPYRLDQVDILQRNPGGKFRWDRKTLTYFQKSYSFMMGSDLDKRCGINEGLSRFSNMTRALYLYQRNQEAMYAP